MMYSFLAISALLVGEWALEFISPSWRLTFQTWPFFAVMSIVALLLTLGVIILGVLCLSRFGYGLSDYLIPRQTSGRNFERITPFDIEKPRPRPMSEESFIDNNYVPFPTDNRGVSWNFVTQMPAARQAAMLSAVAAAHGPRPRPQAPPMTTVTKTTPASLESVKSYLQGGLVRDPVTQGSQIDDRASLRSDDSRSSRSRWSQASDITGAAPSKRWIIQ